MRKMTINQTIRREEKRRAGPTLGCPLRCVSAAPVDDGDAGVVVVVVVAAAAAAAADVDLRKRARFGSWLRRAHRPSEKMERDADAGADAAAAAAGGAPVSGDSRGGMTGGCSGSGAAGAGG